MTPTQDLQLLQLRVRVDWVFSERRGGLWVPIHRFHNLVTNYGLTALAQAPGGLYAPPIYLVIDTASTTVSLGGNPGDPTIQLAADPTLTGDTQLVLSPGAAGQETVTFSSKSFGPPFTYTLVGLLVNAHPLNDLAVRGPTILDTISSVVSEAQYDPTFNPNKRATLTASYSPGLGQGTMQFFLSGLTATNLLFAHVGLADKQTIGVGGTNLHNYAALGYNHNNTNDVEIDVTYTMQVF